MSTQIAVRLPDELVAFIDQQIKAGHAPSRASVVSRALARERRRQIAERDAAVLATGGPDPDLEGLAGFAGGTELGLD